MISISLNFFIILFIQSYFTFLNFFVVLSQTEKIVAATKSTETGTTADQLANTTETKYVMTLSINYNYIFSIM